MSDYYTYPENLDNHNWEDDLYFGEKVLHGQEIIVFMMVTTPKGRKSLPKLLPRPTNAI